MRAGQELPCGGCVADGGAVVDAEDGGQVQRVGVVGEGFFELAVDAQPFQGGGLSAQAGQPGAADGAWCQVRCGC